MVVHLCHNLLTQGQDKALFQVWREQCAPRLGFLLVVRAEPDCDGLVVSSSCSGLVSQIVWTNIVTTNKNGRDEDQFQQIQP